MIRRRYLFMSASTCVLFALITLAWVISSARGTLKAVAQDASVNIGFSRVIHSDILDENRRLRIFLPEGYEPSKSGDYPLFVLSDGPWDFRVAASVINSLSYTGASPPMVVVGISNPNRDRDLIPMKVASIENSGGGGNYLTSLATEFIPYIDATWPTNGFRFFSGHSLGGITALNILSEKPDLFDAYIALSPSMEVGDGMMLEQCRDFFSARESLDKMLYLAVGDEYQERFYFDQLVEFLQENSPRDFLWGSELFDEQDDHNSMRVTGALAGIRWVFRDWRLTSHRIFGMTPEELDAHYVEASLRSKQPRVLSVDEITGAVYWGLRDPEKVGRSTELARLAVERWPNRAAPYAALGDCLATAGTLEDAATEMRRAVQIAAAAGSDHLSFYQGLLDRIEGKEGR